MTIHAHIEKFEGLSVVDFDADSDIGDAKGNAYRVAIDWEAYEEDETFLDRFAAFVSDPAASDVEGLIIGDWGGTAEGNDSAPVVEALVNSREQLPKLRALFLGEMIMEESEISWINQSDVSPIFQAFPNLETLYLRGAGGLELGRPKHSLLRKLVIETGGMPAALMREVTSAELPNLTHLELWLGDEGYGNNIRADDIQALLKDGPCGKLTYLGLRDDCHADDTAKVLAQTGLPAGVETLDLSLGTLGDEGAQALFDSGCLASVKKLSIHHHYVSPALTEKLAAAVAELNAIDVQEPDDWDGEPHRYVAVAE